MILLVTVILWVVAHLPTQDGNAPAIEHSLAGMVGHAIEPVIKPLGFNWRIGIGLITSLAARETIIGTMGTIYGMDPEANTAGLAKGAAARSDARRRMACWCSSPSPCSACRPWPWCAARPADGNGRISVRLMGALAYAGAFLGAHIIHNGDEA